MSVFHGTVILGNLQYNFLQDKKNHIWHTIHAEEHAVQLLYSHVPKIST